LRILRIKEQETCLTLHEQDDDDDDDEEEEQYSCLSMSQVRFKPVISVYEW
jgi:hypothetical protein